MKKLVLTLGTLFFVACSPNTPSSTPINVDKNIKFLEKNSVSIDSLKKMGDNYFFVTMDANKVYFHKLDKNYNQVLAKEIHLLIVPKKLKVFNNRLYLLGFDEKVSKSVLIVLDKNGNEISKKYYGKKFDTPRDFLITKNGLVVGLTHYSKDSSADIVVYKNGTKHTFSTQFSEELTILKPFKDGYLLVGNIEQESQKLLVIRVDKNFKTLWVKDIDFGLEESISDLKIDNNSIILDIISQNYTGMEINFVIKLDEKGNIIEQSKKVEIENLPIRFR